MSSVDTLYEKYSKYDKGEIGENLLIQLREELKGFNPCDLNGVEDHIKYLKLLHLFRERIWSIQGLSGTNFHNTIREMLSVGTAGIYSNELHFMDELIQNVDDCEFDDPANARLDIKCDWTNGKMIFEYNEKGFSPFNVFAITGIAEQAKNIDKDKVQIGEKGLGFKSVFGVANSVWIQSGFFSFRLNEDNFTCPIPEYESFEYVSGTKLTLYMDKEKVKNIYETFSSTYKSRDSLLCNNPLLFLNKLSELRVYFDNYKSLKFIVERKLDISTVDRLQKAEHVKISYEQGGGYKDDDHYKNEITCTQYIMPITYDREACVSRYGEKTDFTSKKMNLQVIVPDIEFVKNKGISKGRFYSFLPTKIEIPVPIVCHIPFRLAPSREDVDSQNDNKWFKYSCKMFSAMIDKVVLDLAEVYKEDVVYYLPKHSDYLFNSTKGYGILCLPEFKGEHFINLPLFYTETVGFLSADKVYVFSEPEKVKSIRRISELLNEKKQLFIAPDISKIKGLKIDIISNVTDRLFSIALSKSKHAEEIFKILEVYEGFSFEDKVKNINNAEFDIDLVNAILNNEKCSDTFKDHAKKRARLARLNYSFNTDGFTVIDVKKVDDKQEILDDDFGKYSRQYLGWINNRVVVTHLIPAEQYFIANNVLILSKDGVLNALSSFCQDLDPKDSFAAMLILRDCSRELDMADDSTPSEEYMRKLRNVRNTIRTTFGKEVYNNYINILNQSGTNPERYINELLQNADDCKYPEGIDPDFRLEIDKGLKKIGTRYNEVGFTNSNVRAITAIGESTKKRLIAGEKDGNVIGEKGIGFKAVFAVANTVSIFSGDFAFELSASEPTIPKLLDKKPECSNGTTMIFRLKEEIAPDFFTEEKVLRLCLCLRKLRHLKLDKFDVSIQDEDGIRYITINNNIYKYKTIAYDFVVDDEQALSERRGLNKEISEEQTIKFYIPTEKKAAVNNLYLYSGLPTGIQTNIPLIIDAPFELDTARNDVLKNEWNSYITDKLYECLKETVVSLTETEGIDVLRFINVKRENNVSSIDLFSNSKLNKSDFLAELKSVKILPTWKQGYFACATQYELYRVPKWLNYVLENGGEVGQDLSTLLKYRGDKYDGVLNALGVKNLPLEKAVRLLKNCCTEFIQDKDFSKHLYSYFEEHIDSMDMVRQLLKDMQIIPVKGKREGNTEYRSWNECNTESGLNLFVNDLVMVSDDGYWILRTDSLKKDICEKIFGRNINELTDDFKRIIYEKELINKIKSGLNSQQLYEYLLNEFTNNYKLLSQCQDSLYRYRESIPLKNQLGEIKRGKIYISRIDGSYYYGKLFPSHLVHKQCERLAKFIGCKDISTVHFDDLDVLQPLTRDDVETLQDETIGIINSDEIISRCIERGLISLDLIAEYGLGAYSPVNIDYYEDVFNQPIDNRQRFYENIRERINNPSLIIVKTEEREVQFYRIKDKDYPLNYSERRDYIMRKYTLSSKKDYCVCQMCKKAKKINYIEVNNLELLPKYYWVECGVSLCLECSKRFEELRENRSIRDRFYKKILETDVNVDKPIEIPITDSETITFKQTHLAEIQEILKKQ